MSMWKEAAVTEQKVLKRWIEESGNIVFFGGAGVSTESGIPDFRTGFIIRSISIRRRRLSATVFIGGTRKSFSDFTETR